MKFQSDIDLLKTSFTSALGSSSGKLNALFTYLEEMSTLIRLEFSQVTVQVLLQSYAAKYSGEYRDIARNVANCCLKLRPVDQPLAL